MKDQKREVISLARHGNTFAKDYDASRERTLKQMHNNRIRQELYRDGYALAVKGGNIDDVTETVEIDGKIINKKSDKSFIAGYTFGLETLKGKITSEEPHKTR